jgi:hypothetical protein
MVWDRHQLIFFETSETKPNKFHNIDSRDPAQIAPALEANPDETRMTDLAART